MIVSRERYECNGMVVSFLISDTDIHWQEGTKSEIAIAKIDGKWEEVWTGSPIEGKEKYAIIKELVRDRLPLEEIIDFFCIG